MTDIDLMALLTSPLHNATHTPEKDQPPPAHFATLREALQQTLVLHEGEEQDILHTP